MFASASGNGGQNGILKQPNNGWYINGVGCVSDPLVVASSMGEPLFVPGRLIARIGGKPT